MTDTRSEKRIGVDVGATLAKLVIGNPGHAPEFHLLPSSDRDAVVERVREAGPARIGLTGCGASALAQALDLDGPTVTEFAAWGRGALQLLEDQGVSASERFLLVSLGTGTSVMMADGEQVTRVGGTALGGGTLLGLAQALLGIPDYDRLVELAARGRRERVDLLVSDIYEGGQIALAGDLTAASFGKLGRPGTPTSAAKPEDLASAILGLVGENVGLICAGLAGALQIDHVVFGGSTVRANPPLAQLLAGLTGAGGSRVTFLERGEYAGALGALLLAGE